MINFLKKVGVVFSKSDKVVYFVLVYLPIWPNIDKYWFIYCFYFFSKIVRAVFIKTLFLRFLPILGRFMVQLWRHNSDKLACWPNNLENLEHNCNAYFKNFLGNHFKPLKKTAKNWFICWFFVYSKSFLGYLWCHNSVKSIYLGQFLQYNWRHSFTYVINFCFKLVSAVL